MILVDANLLIYATNGDVPDHKAAKRWLEQVLNDSRTVALTWSVLLAFLRLSTRPGIFSAPLDPGRASAIVDEWLIRPQVVILNPGENHWRVFQNLIRSAGTAGNLTSDAHLAAIAIEHGAVLYSADHDFQRFAGLSHVNPLKH